MREYSIELEVAGPLAMFARPDTGSTPVSYPVPTWSAAKGMFESVAFFSSGDAWFYPTRIEICRSIGEPGGRVQFQRYATNYRGPLRKSDLIKNDNSMQLFATVLTDVCYRLHAEICGEHSRGRNPKHHLSDLFNRRLRQGRCHRTPCLGWSEFTCSYWGPPRHEETEVDDALDISIPSMLFGVWDRPVKGAYAPSFVQENRARGFQVERGVLKFDGSLIGAGTDAE